jgi:hypothetical protein
LSSSVNATLPSPASSFFCWFLMGLWISSGGLLLSLHWNSSLFINRF